MNSDRDKTSILDVLFDISRMIFFAGLAIFFLVNGHPMGLLFGVVAIFLMWSFVKTVRFGVRVPNRWERFRAWMNVRPVIIGGLGLALVMALVTYGPPKLTEEMKIALTGSILVWCGLLFYTMWRAKRPRLEDDTTYKKRIGWKDLD